MTENAFENVKLDEFIIMALKEDIGAGDKTTSYLVDPSLQGRATVLAKEELVVAGMAPFKRVFQLPAKLFTDTGEVLLGN